MKNIKIILILLVSFQWGLNAEAQIITSKSIPIDSDSVRMAFDEEPYFGLYKDNYFIFGPSIGQKPTNTNTNVKFQISLRLKLTKSTLSWGTYLYLFYSQKAFWNVLEESLPMTDINFNPGIGIAKPLFSKGQYVGKLMFQVEHESNGRDSVYSRSWNHISVGGDFMLTHNALIHAKFWIPYVDSDNNRDILKYVGIGQVGVELMSNNRRWRGSLLLVKRKTWKLDFNSVAEVSWQVTARQNWHLFAQYYNGYGEGLLDYNVFSSHLRVGLVFRPKYFSDY